MPNLQSVSITFNTHEDDKDDSTVLHVFVKNRSRTTERSEGAATFIADQLAFDEALSHGPFAINPFLASAVNLSAGQGFGNNSSHTFTIPLRPGAAIPLEEVDLPVVNIHILPDGSDQWIFDYTATLTFDQGPPITWSSTANGVTGIVLDQDHLDYSGIGVENPSYAPPQYPKPQVDAVLTQVRLDFYTHGDDKDNDTTLNVHIVNRLNAAQSQDIAVAVHVLDGQAFSDPSLHTALFGEGGLPLAPNAIQMRDIVLPVVNINIGPNGDDRWAFDYKVTYTFTDLQFPQDKYVFSSTTSGVVLDQTNHKHTSAYQGGSFPSAIPPRRPALSNAPVNHLAPAPKRIPLSFLQSKLVELVNNRQGVGGQDPPITRIRLHNSGVFGSALPQSYYDVQSLVADPVPPGTIPPVGYNESTRYTHSPTVLGQETKGPFGIANLYFDDINSNSLTVNVDATDHATPLTVALGFETGGPLETAGSDIGGMDFTTFNITLHLTLAYDQENARVDLMSWVDEINALVATRQAHPFSVEVSGQFLGQPITIPVPVFDDEISNLIGRVIDVHIVTTHALDPGGATQKSMRETIFKTLWTTDWFDGVSVRDTLNAFLNSWLLGGVVNKGNASPLGYVAPCKVQDAHIDGTDFVISYTGPQQTFQPPIPAGWPANAGFGPSTLDAIDHIVVLTMENRSFDHMMGYLSLPPDKGGMGRTDVDGLKGGESNLLDGLPCPSFAFAPGDTVFSPDPPHDTEPVGHAINGGKMDGFAEAYARERGVTVGPRIMGYHTAANVPTYDALTRDFALCQRWFAAHPGPTFCNRFYEMTGWLNIDPHGYWELSNSSPLRPVFTPTIFDHLSTQGVSWKYFENHYCFLRFFEGHTFDTANIAPFGDPEFGFAALARSGNLPSVTFIDPHFIELPPGGNCDGPPADIRQGQLLVEQVVEAVVAGPAWDKTLLIITYDEHGGFYDHVPPPPAPQVSPELPTTYGVRVPAFIVSPWVTPGSVFGNDGLIVHPVGGGAGQPTRESLDKTPSAETPTAETPAAETPTADFGPGHNLFLGEHFDHTSILKTIARRFLGAAPPYMGARYAAARDLSSAVGATPHTPQFRPFIPYTLTYGASGKCLDVPGGSSAPGTALWQYDPNGTPAQQFSFEDAGGGLVFIRTRPGRLYLTATGTSGGVTQTAKRPAGGTGASSPDAQRWRLSPGAVSAVNSDAFTIFNAAFPGVVLQPTGGSTQSTAAVVLGAPTPTHSITVPENAWQITSPLLPSRQVVNAPVQPTGGPPARQA